MSDKYFLDSNICIYLMELDTQKQAIALNLMIKNRPVISTQVITENINVLTRKLLYSKEDAFQHAQNLITICDLAIINEQILRKAFTLSLKYQYRYFDSLIISAALENGCRILYSEDMHHSQVIDNQTTIINPFLS